MQKKRSPLSELLFSSSARKPVTKNKTAVLLLWSVKSRGDKLSQDSRKFYTRCLKAYRQFVFASTVWQSGVFALAAGLLLFALGNLFYHNNVWKQGHCFAIGNLNNRKQRQWTSELCLLKATCYDECSWLWLCSCYEWPPYLTCS